MIMFILKMKVRKIKHRGYEEFEKAKKKGIDIPQLLGKYQYPLRILRYLLYHLIVIYNYTF